MTDIVAGLQLGWTRGTTLAPNQNVQNRLAVYHADLHAVSIFLSWPSGSGVPPEIFFGDFGNALLLCNDSADSVGDLLEDVSRIGTQLIGLVDSYHVEAFNFDDE